MLITKDDYSRRGHILLESTSGRRDLFSLLRDEIDTGLKQGVSEAVSAIRDVKSFIKGDNLLFLNYDLPNIWSLKDKKEAIKKDGLLFLEKNYDRITKTCIKTVDINHKFDILFLLIKFTTEIQKMPQKNYTDLYIVMFHTLLFMDQFEGKDNEKNSVVNLLIRGLARYDATMTGEMFVRNSRLGGLLKESLRKYPPYSEYVNRIDISIKNILRSSSFKEEDFTPLVFTDTLFFTIGEWGEGGLRELFLKSKERVFSFVNERNDLLLTVRKEERDLLKSKLSEVIQEKIDWLKNNSPKQIESRHTPQWTEISKN